MKVTYTAQEKAEQELTSDISSYAYGITGGKNYNIHYSPFHLSLAKFLVKLGYRKIKHKLTPISTTK